MDCSLDRGEDFVACEFVATAQCEGIYLNTMGCSFLNTDRFLYHDTWFIFPMLLFTVFTLYNQSRICHGVQS